MNAPPSKKANKNWLKLGIIPLLAGVLGYVIWSNQAPSPAALSEVAMAATPASIPAPSIAPSNVVSAPAPEVKRMKRVAWPKFTTDQILATNPFRGSAAMRNALKPVTEQPAAADADKVAADLRRENADVDIDPWAALADSFRGDSSAVFLNSSKGSVLRVGSKSIKVGDRIGDRYRVTEVRPDGIIVEAAPASK